jgi:hypothetical protein
VGMFLLGLELYLMWKLVMRPLGIHVVGPLRNDLDVRCTSVGRMLLEVA